MSKPIKKTLYHVIVSLIETARAETAVYLNAKVSQLYWNIGAVINKDILQNKRATYGTEIVATQSQQFSCSHLTQFVAIELKPGKFKPAYKGQMALHLNWLKKHDMQTGKDTPLGLLLCSEGNTEHIELLNAG
ncbi:MAG: PDDEXK nuclease domain-containing protein [Bacillota bacterium]|nr:PDDEXK nuclease domain-containing protein [Bacillota bacterium]